jgi:retron-type reverse transcriptase
MELLRFLLSNCRTKYGRGTSEVSNGVPQGSTLSPMLFNIYIEELAERMQQAGIISLLYADDVVIIGNDDEIKEAVRILEEWC